MLRLALIMHGFHLVFCELKLNLTLPGRSANILTDFHPSPKWQIIISSIIAIIVFGDNRFAGSCFTVHDERIVFLCVCASLLVWFILPTEIVGGISSSRDFTVDKKHFRQEVNSRLIV